MSSVLCKQVDARLWQLQCDLCGQDTDVVDIDCLTWLIVYGEGHLCFECDGTAADKISPVLWQNETPYVLTVDGTMIGCDWPTSLRSLKKTCDFLRQELYKAVNPHTLIVERDFRISCLSSFSNLKKVSGDE